MAKRVLFIDRDGTLIIEPQSGNIDSWDKLEFLPHVFKYMNLIATEFDYELTIVSNQDGLGTDYFPYSDFQPIRCPNRHIHFHFPCACAEKYRRWSGYHIHTRFRSSYW